MKKLEHSLAGLGAGVLVAHFLGVDSLPLLALSVGISVVGASIPDMDQRWAPRGYVPRPGSPCKLMEHRGPTHSAILAVVTGYALVLLSLPLIGMAFAAGWLSHLLMDSVSPQGEPFLWPITAKRFQVLPFWLRVHLKSGNRVVDLPLALLTLALCLFASGLFNGTFPSL